MNALLKNLREQHQEILKMIARKADIAEIINLVANIHHPIEEKELFPLIATSPLLREGGPMCTFFRGMDLDLNINHPTRIHLQEFYKLGFEQSLDYPSFEWLKDHSPLSIPMEEHKLGHDLVNAIEILKTTKNSPVYAEFFEVLCYDYTQLLRRHIDKEDRCLFIMCEKILD